MNEEAIIAVVHGFKPSSYMATHEIQASFTRYMDIGEEFRDHFQEWMADSIVDQSHDWLRPMCHTDGPFLENLAAVADKAAAAFPKPICFVWAHDISAIVIIEGDPQEVLQTIRHHTELLQEKIAKHSKETGIYYANEI